MRINFRQGLIAFQKDAGTPTFLEASATSGFISQLVSPTPTIVTAAHGASDYLMQFDRSVDLAWGPIIPDVTNYLYWDLDLMTGEVTRGITTLPVIAANEAPPAVADQHWFDLSTTTMKVWSASRNKWVTKVRVLAGSVLGSTVSPKYEGSQVSLNVPANPGFIMRDHMLQPLRTSSGEFLTDDSPVHVNTSVGTSGVLVQPVNRIVPVRAGENIPAMSLVYFSNDDLVRLASSDPSHIPMRVPVGIILSALSTGDIGHLSPFGEVSYDQWDWTGHAGEALYIDFNGQLTLTRPNGLLAYRVGFIKNKNTVLLGIDAETFPQVYTANANDLIIAGATPVYTTDTVNGLGERVVTISVPVVGAGNGLMTPAQAAAVADHDERLGVAETAITNLDTAKADAAHNHVIADVTGLQDALDDKAVLSHDHDTVYAPLSHAHTLADISDLNVLEDQIDLKANRAHLNSFDEIFSTVVRTSSTDVGSGETLVQALADKANTVHLHSADDVTAETGHHLLYIDRRRSDAYTANGSCTKPFKTISAAITKAVSNADGATTPYTFVIAEGTYNEEILLNSTGLSNVSIVGLGRVAIDPGTGNALTCTTGNSDLSDLVIRNVEFADPVVITGDSTANQFKNVTFYDVAMSAITATCMNSLNIRGGYISGNVQLLNVAWFYWDGVQHDAQTITVLSDTTATMPSWGMANAGGYFVGGKLQDLALSRIGTGNYNVNINGSYVGLPPSAYTVPAGFTVNARNSVLRGTWTNNGAMNLYASSTANPVLGTAPNYPGVRVPASAPNGVAGIGVAGDVAGQTKYDAAGNVYTAVANYDGSTVIWKSTADLYAAIDHTHAGGGGGIDPHTHEITDVNGLQTELDNKASLNGDINESFSASNLRSIKFGFQPNSGLNATQITNKTTAVAFDFPDLSKGSSGQITLSNSELAAGAVATFQFNNPQIEYYDTIVLNINNGGDGATLGAYTLTVEKVDAGYCLISIHNRSAVGLSEAVGINFAVIKGGGFQ